MDPALSAKLGSLGIFIKDLRRSPPATEKNSKKSLMDCDKQVSIATVIDGSQPDFDQVKR
jgi:hypothetical protein